MSEKRETDKIKFFELGTEGEIRPAFPDPTGPSQQAAPAEEVRVNSTQSIIVDQLDQMKPKLDSLTSGEKGFTAEEASVLKKYLALREAEVEDLRENLGQYKEHFQKVTAELTTLNDKNRNLVRECDSRKKSEEISRIDLIRIKQELEEKILTLTSDFEERLRAQGGLDHDVKELERQKAEWKNSVAENLRRIRLKEREIETKHEMLKRDSEVLLDSKDKQLIDLKRKCDALELEMESLEERVRAQNMALANVEARKKRLLETLRLAMALIEGIERGE